MTSEENSSGDTGSQQTDETPAGGHSDAGFRQLGGEETVDPGATDTDIGGTGGVDGGTEGGLRNEKAPDIMPPSDSSSR
jgi:hypothetical protein